MGFPINSRLAWDALEPNKTKELALSMAQLHLLYSVCGWGVKVYFKLKNL